MLKTGRKRLTNPINNATHFGNDVSSLNLADKRARPATASENNLSFADLIDVVNPLHHLPVVGTIYRTITEDTINPVMKLAGGALFGGPLGVLFSAVSLAFTGKSEEPEVTPGGVDAAAVANTYPFAEADAAGTAQLASAMHAGQSDTDVSSEHRYGDGILNPAWQPVRYRPDMDTLAGINPDTVVTYADGIPNPAAVTHNAAVNELLALRDTHTETKLRQPDAAWVHDAYQLQELSLEAEEQTTPLIDIVIGKPADAS